MFLLDLPTRQFDELSVFPARGADGLAGAAIEAAIHVGDESFADLELALVHERHLADSSAWGIRFFAPEAVCRAMIQAKAAMNAARVICVCGLLSRGEPTLRRRGYRHCISVNLRGVGSHALRGLLQSGPAQKCRVDRKPSSISSFAQNRRAPDPKPQAMISISPGTMGLSSFRRIRSRQQRFAPSRRKFWRAILRLGPAGAMQNR